MIVDNAPGAGGTIGIQNLLRAKPDGYTLVMGSLGPNAANYTLRKSLPYKPEDLTPVIHVLSMPNVLVANTQLGAKSIADLKGLSKSLPKGLSMAVSTSGSSGHLTGELLKSSTGIKAVNIVYRGAAPALTDLIGGQVDIMVDNLITSLPQIRGGKLVPIAVTSPQRVPELPDVPTFVEAGYPDIEVAVWLGLFVSAETPPAMVCGAERGAAESHGLGRDSQAVRRTGRPCHRRVTGVFSAFRDRREESLGKSDSSRRHHD